MSVHLAEQLAEFAECGNQHRLYLNTGQLIQGWIMEITEQAVLISTGFSEKTGEDHWINLDQINLSKLEYWDTHKQDWQVWMPHQD